MNAVRPHLASAVSRRRRGFTLLELLVVVSIVALISGLLLVGVTHSRKTANVIRSQSDLSLIATALDAYQHDFADYPRFADLVTVQSVVNVPGSGFWLDTSTDRGARMLCRALLGPGPAGPTTAPPAAADNGFDGADGNGFRVVRNVVATGPNTAVLSGKVYGPYIQSDKFKLEYDTTGALPNMQDAKLLDHAGHPILYFPGRSGPPTVTQQYGFVYSVNPLTTNASPPVPLPLYNPFDNQADSTPAANARPFLSAADMQTILGDADHNGQINAAEVAVTTQPYLLWTANPNGSDQLYYGLQADGKCDAVCNFDVPPALRK